MKELKKNTDEIDIELDGLENDAQMRSALRHFRDSVHAWSEDEFSRVRQPRKSGFFFAARRPVLSWAVAAVLAMTAVSVPLADHYQQVHRQARDAFAREQKQIAAEVAAKQRAYAINDEELLSHVDEDIAQDSPDAMEPLASLMTNTSSLKR